MSKSLKIAMLSVLLIAGLLVAHFAGYLPLQIAEPTANTAQVAPETPVEQALEEPASEETEAAPAEAIEPPAKPANIPGNYEYFYEEGFSAEAAEE